MNLISKEKKELDDMDIDVYQYDKIDGLPDAILFMNQLKNGNIEIKRVDVNCYSDHSEPGKSKFYYDYDNLLSETDIYSDQYIETVVAKCELDKSVFYTTIDMNNNQVLVSENKKKMIQII